MQDAGWARLRSCWFIGLLQEGLVVHVARYLEAGPVIEASALNVPVGHEKAEGFDEVELRSRADAAPAYGSYIAGLFRLVEYNS